MSRGAPVVFVVDDDVSVRESLELLIDSAGWQSKTFGSAKEFLSYPRIPRAPGCVVLDVSLSDLSGLELQGRVALGGIDMPIILISGYGDDSMRVRALSAGAVAFLTKPLDADELLRAIQDAIGRSGGGPGHERDT